MTEQDQHPRFNNLENCTNSLRESIDILKRSNQLLDDTLQGSSRLTKILSTRKVFDLIPELDLNDAKRNFANNINPQITDNMDRLQHELVKLSNQKNDLTSQLKQLKARTKEYDNRTAKRRKTHALSDGDIESLLSSPNVHEKYDIGKIRQLQVLRDKKNRLKYTLSRMN